MENTILILGAAALQVPLINYVKERGYKVAVVSIPGQYPGFELADKSIYCDVRDTETILNSTKNDRIVAVLTDETDLPVLTVAEIANRLGLPGNSPDVARAYSNKYIMRQKCEESDVSVPKFYRISSSNDVDECCKIVSFPALIKPEDNQGSRGIHLINSKKEIEVYLKDSLRFSSNGHAIVEEYFEGHEIVCEGFVIDGEYINWGIADRRYFDIDGMYIPSQTIFPSVISQGMQDKILSAEKRLHARLAPSFGMIHSEYLVNENTGEYILVETALRGGGVYISSHLVPCYTNYDNYSLLLNCSLGNKPAINSIEKNIKREASAYICFYLDEGTVQKVEGIDTILNLDFVIHADFETISDGEEINKIVNKTQRLGPIIVKGKDRNDIERNINTIQSLLKISVKNGNEVSHKIYW